MKPLNLDERKTIALPLFSLYCSNKKSLKQMALELDSVDKWQKLG